MTPTLTALLPRRGAPVEVAALQAIPGVKVRGPRISIPHRPPYPRELDLMWNEVVHPQPEFPRCPESEVL